MLDLSDLLASTATVIRVARERSAVAVPPPSPAAVDAVLERLPVVVREALEEDHGAEHATLLTMLTATERALGAAVVERLVAAGVHMAERIERRGSAPLPAALLVSIPSVLAAVARRATDAALTPIAAAWHSIGGLTVQPDPHAGTLTFTAPAGRYVVAPGWQGRAVAEVVEEARAALALPRWPLSALVAAWSARAGTTASARLERGAWIQGRFLSAAQLDASSLPLPPAALCLRIGEREAWWPMDRETLEAGVDGLVERGALALLPPAVPVVPTPPASRSLRNRAALS